MGETNLAWHRYRSATDQARLADRVVWGAEGPRGQERLAGRQETERTVDTSRLDRLGG